MEKVKIYKCFLLSLLYSYAYNTRFRTQIFFNNDLLHSFQPNLFNVKIAISKKFITKTVMKPAPPRKARKL